MRDYVLHVGGVPGTGKSTLARLLADELGCRTFEASSILEELGLLREDPTGRFTRLVDEAGLERLAKRVTEHLGKSCAILVSVYPEALITLLEEATLAVILLRLNPLVLEERLAKRSWPRPKVLENVIAEALNYYHDVLSEYEDLVIEVDTTSREPREVLHEVVNKLVGMETGFSVDWLENPSIVDALSKWLGELDSYKDWAAQGRTIY